MEPKNDNLLSGSEETNLGVIQNAWSVRFLRGMTRAAIHTAILILGIIGWPIVLLSFLLGAILLLPFMAFWMGCRFIWHFYELHFSFPRLWSSLPIKRHISKQEASESMQ